MESCGPWLSNAFTKCCQAGLRIRKLVLDERRSVENYIKVFRDLVGTPPACVACNHCNLRNRRITKGGAQLLVIRVVFHGYCSQLSAYSQVSSINRPVNVIAFVVLSAVAGSDVPLSFLFIIEINAVQT